MWVLPDEDDVGALARERQLVLDQHLDVAESGGHQIRPEGGDAALPGPVLAGGWLAAGAKGHLLGKEVGKVGLDR